MSLSTGGDPSAYLSTPEDQLPPLPPRGWVPRIDPILEEALRLEGAATMARRLRYAGTSRKPPKVPTIIRYAGRCYTRKWLVRYAPPELRLAVARHVLAAEERASLIARRRIEARWAREASMGRP